jgi:hypothetical protein
LQKGPHDLEQVLGSTNWIVQNLVSKYVRVQGWSGELIILLGQPWRMAFGSFFS